MEVRNQKEAVPFAHYEARFRQLDPQEALRRLKALTWDGDCFYVSLLGTEYALSHPQYAIRPSAPLQVQTFLLRWLLESRDVSPLGQWKTFREMPWGEMYAVPYAGRVLTRAAFSFGPRLDAFRAACEKLGGIPLDRGDAGFRFTLVGDYGMQILLWEGDEEFPPSAQILYSDNFAQGFTAEDRVVAADILIGAIKEHM